MREVTAIFDIADAAGKVYQVERIQHYRQLCPRTGAGELVATFHEYRTSCGLHLQRIEEGTYLAWETGQELRFLKKIVERA
jgi:ribosomal protein S27AE